MSVKCREGPPSLVIGMGGGGDSRIQILQAIVAKHENKLVVFNRTIFI